MSKEKKKPAPPPPPAKVGAVECPTCKKPADAIEHHPEAGAGGVLLSVCGAGHKIRLGASYRRKLGLLK